MPGLTPNSAPTSAPQAQPSNWKSVLNNLQNSIPTPAQVGDALTDLKNDVIHYTEAQRRSAEIQAYLADKTKKIGEGTRKGLSEMKAMFDKQVQQSSREMQHIVGNAQEGAGKLADAGAELAQVTYRRAGVLVQEASDYMEEHPKAKMLGIGALLAGVAYLGYKFAKRGEEEATKEKPSWGWRFLKYMGIATVATAAINHFGGKAEAKQNVLAQAASGQNFDGIPDKTPLKGATVSLEVTPGDTADVSLTTEGNLKINGSEYIVKMETVDSSGKAISLDASTQMKAATFSKLGGGIEISGSGLVGSMVKIRVSGDEFKRIIREIKNSKNSSVAMQIHGEQSPIFGNKFVPVSKNITFEKNK